MVFNRRSVCAGLVVALFSGQSLADSHQPVILTVSGVGEQIEYTLADLMELGSDTFETATIWTVGVKEFTGVSLARLIEELGITEGRLMAQAINDYAVEVPLEDGVENGPIIAYMMDGEPMSVRDKGPLWLVYPFDLNPAYRSEVIYSRSIWQLDRIEVLP